MNLPRYVFSAALVTIVFSGTAMAQHQPYAGMQARPIKALSEQQVADLRAGRGMGLALAAELNGYPGPSHVLELSKELDLSQSQRKQIENLFAAMKAETIPIGERLVTLEQDLDHQFASRTITTVSLASSASEIGALQGKLRAAHLKYHLLTQPIMTTHQAARYSELRGYAQSSAQHRPAH